MLRAASRAPGRFSRIRHRKHRLEPRRYFRGCKANSSQEKYVTTLRSFPENVSRVKSTNTSSPDWTNGGERPSRAKATQRVLPKLDDAKRPLLPERRMVARLPDPF